MCEALGLIPSTKKEKTKLYSVSVAIFLLPQKCTVDLNQNPNKANILHLFNTSLKNRLIYDVCLPFPFTTWKKLGHLSW
jgi:hypothetical protein